MRDYVFGGVPLTKGEVREALDKAQDLEVVTLFEGKPLFPEPTDAEVTESRVNHEWAVAQAGVHASSLFYECCPYDSTVEPNPDEDVEVRRLLKKATTLLQSEKVSGALKTMRELTTRFNDILKAREEASSEHTEEYDLRYLTLDRWGHIDAQVIKDTLCQSAPLYEKAKLAATLFCMDADLEAIPGGVEERAKMQLGGYLAHASNYEAKAKILLAILRSVGIPEGYLGAFSEAVLVQQFSGHILKAHASNMLESLEKSPIICAHTSPLGSIKNIEGCVHNISPKMEKDGNEKMEALVSSLSTIYIRAGGDLEKVLKTVGKKRLLSLGLARGKKETERAYIGRLLRLVGLTQKAKHVARGKPREYYLENPTEWMGLCSREYAKKTNRPVPTVEELEARLAEEYGSD